MRIWPGRPYPLGATWDGRGVNFALYSENAEKVELCLFDSADDAKESVRIVLTEHTNMIWHAYLPEVRPGQVYGYRVSRPLRPRQGASLQRQQAAVGSLRQGDRPPAQAGRLALGLHPGRQEGRPLVQSHRQRRRRAAGRGHRRGVHLGRRSPAQHPAAPLGDLRSARQGLHEAPPRSPRAGSRHLRRHGLGAGDQIPPRARRHRRRAAARARALRRPLPPRPRPRELLGLQHDGLLRPRSALRVCRTPRPRRSSANSRRWFATCTMPASR